VVIVIDKQGNQLSIADQYSEKVVHFVGDLGGHLTACQHPVYLHHLHFTHSTAVVRLKEVDVLSVLPFSRHCGLGNFHFS